MKKQVRDTLALALLALPFAAGAALPQYTEEREVYQQAMKAIQKNDSSTYEQSRYLLKDYPLAPYLEYEQIENNFSKMPTRQVDAFLQKNEGAFIAKKLHQSWMGHLAHNREWTLFRTYYRSDLSSETLDCHKLQADLALADNPDVVYIGMYSMWLKPHSLPDSCNRIFAEWKDRGYQTQELIWKRFQMALTGGDSRLTRYLGETLRGEEAKLAERLQNPVRHMNYFMEYLASTEQAIPLESRTVKYILRQYTHRDHERVARLLENHNPPMNEEDVAEIRKLCAWYMAKESGYKAQEWLARNTTTSDRNDYHEHRLRFALQDKEWKLYQYVYRQAPLAVQEQQEWLYWYAISQRETRTRDKDPARTPDAILTRLSTEYGFYAVLAAEAKKLPHLPQASKPVSDIVVTTEVARKLAPALEFYRMGDKASANREWYFTTKAFNKDEWAQAGMMAHEVAWYDKSIHALGKAEYWWATEQRFPIVFEQHFREHSQKQSIAQGWLFAMARQESAFSPTARSPVGALGILQLMPETARRVASKLNVPYSQERLVEPSYNIRLGTQYLKDMLGRFDNNYVLATAAYNAGPGKVREWLEMRPITEDWAHWVATIPYKETRQYVQNIMAFSKIYQAKLDDQQMIQASREIDGQATAIR